MATQEIKDLLLEAGPFARLSATEQRTRLVRYYEPWFTPGWKPDTVNNIRCTQRLVTHARSMAVSVGVVLQAILLEASGIEPSSRGLLGVEVDQADPQGCIPDPELAQSVSELARAPLSPTPPSPDPPPFTGIPKRRGNRVK
jgi:hypothetical protein